MDRINNKYYALHIIKTPLTCRASKRSLTACVLLDCLSTESSATEVVASYNFLSKGTNMHTCDGVKGENKIKRGLRTTYTASSAHSTCKGVWLQGQLGLSETPDHVLTGYRLRSLHLFPNTPGLCSGLTT